MGFQWYIDPLCARYFGISCCEYIPHTHARAQTHTHTHTYTHTSTHTHLYTRSHTHLCTHTYAHTNTHSHADNKDNHVSYSKFVSTPAFKLQRQLSNLEAGLMAGCGRNQRGQKPSIFQTLWKELFPGTAVTWNFYNPRRLTATLGKTNYRHSWISGR